uniref:F5/8 type C domain-containing protein n=1 Tax=Panthera leo TaxID=9689 RepID=A0A8C8WAT1_PANLE
MWPVLWLLWATGGFRRYSERLRAEARGCREPSSHLATYVCKCPSGSWVQDYRKAREEAGRLSKKCDEPLVSGLPHGAFSSSSSTSGSYSPGYAKINKRGGAGGWSPSDSDHYQWLQVDFGNRKQISAIATQGRYSSSDWVTQYRMLYSDTGRNWKPYHQDGNIWNFVKHGISSYYIFFWSTEWKWYKLYQHTKVS